MNTATDGSQVIMILGMHRAGTSVAARALQALGIALGDTLTPAAPDNPKGFFEDRAILSLDEDLLAALGGKWHHLQLANWDCLPAPRRRAFLTRAQRLIHARLRQHGTWAFKDPRATRLLSFWKTCFAIEDLHPRLVLANRHPAAVAASLARRDQIPHPIGLALWLRHQHQALGALLEQDGLVLDYERVLAAPEQELGRLGRYLGCHELRTSEQDAFAQGFLDKTLNHAPTLKLGKDPLSRNCQDLHLWLLEAATAPGVTTTPELLSNGRDLYRHLTHEIEAQRPWCEAIDQLDARRRALDADLHHTALDLQALAASHRHQGYRCQGLEHSLRYERAENRRLRLRLARLQSFQLHLQGHASQTR